MKTYYLKIEADDSVELEDIEMVIYSDSHHYDNPSKPKTPIVSITAFEPIPKNQYYNGVHSITLIPLKNEDK